MYLMGTEEARFREYRVGPITDIMSTTKPCAGVKMSSKGVLGSNRAENRYKNLVRSRWPAVMCCSLSFAMCAHVILKHRNRASLSHAAEVQFITHDDLAKLVSWIVCEYLRDAPLRAFDRLTFSGVCSSKQFPQVVLQVALSN